MHNTFFKGRRHTCRLWHACRTAVSSIALLFAGVVTNAQTYPNGLSADSVSPALDRQFIVKVRAQMDSIHRNCHRPTVALVLSGGGAKGAAEVGALKYLEERGIPIDFVCGTSIGGLLGGLLAVGYTSDDMRDLFISQDWMTTLTDRIDPEYRSLFFWEYKSKYMLNVPFKYEDEDFMQRVREQEKYWNADGGGRGSSKGLSTRKGVNSLVSSLPSGYVYGLNVNNLLSALTVGYHDSLSFTSLPIPFVCVSSDMVSCKAKNWGEGTLKTAMRSTMSIPGLFDPVREQGMILVDGGTRNNFPTDIAKAVGADYIIGVELSDINPSYSELNNIGDIASQFITMLGTDSLNKNISEADVIIKPDLQGYNMLSFTSAAVDTMILRGYSAAAEQAELISEIKSLVPDAETSLKGPPATDIRNRKVLIGSVDFVGVSGNESRLLKWLVKVKEGTYVGNEEMVRAMSIIQSTGAFETVTYSLLGKEEPYDLVFNCRKGPIHQAGLGLRMDTEEWVAVAFNVCLNAHKLSGVRLDMSAKVGQSQSAGARFMVGTPKTPYLNVEASIANYFCKVKDVEYNSDFVRTRLSNDASYWTHKEQIYLQKTFWRDLDVRVGMKNQYYQASDKHVYGSVAKARYGDAAMRGDYLGAFGSVRLYTLDDIYYPSRGVDLKLSANYDFKKIGVKEFKPIAGLNLDFRPVIRIGGHVAVIPSLYSRFIFDDNPVPEEPVIHGGTPMSMAHSNFIGGFIPGRYIEGQVPYVGFNNIVAAYDKLAALNMDVRVRVVKNLYLSALAGAYKDGETINDLFNPDSGNFDYAFGLEAAYDLFLGPVRLNLHWDRNMGWGAHLALGYDF